MMLLPRTALVLLALGMLGPVGQKGVTAVGPFEPTTAPRVAPEAPPADTLRAGYDRALLLGTDHPTLPVPFLKQADHALETPEALCLGPTEDGGFYLVGMSAYYPQLFEDMSYSHPQVFSDTLARADRTNARLTILPPWYDVDTPSDLTRMLADLDQGTADAPNTRRIANQLELAALL